MQMVAQNRVKEVIILAGGRGSRLGELGINIPKPLVSVGGKPIIEHIMDRWALAGVTRFIVAGGFMVKAFQDHQWKYDVRVVDTGLETQTAERVYQSLKFTKCELVGLSYGDGITTYPLELLMSNHAERNPYGMSMLVTHPISRFGEVKFSDTGRVTEFSEKPVITDRWINAGYFIISRGLSHYFDTHFPLEVSTLLKLSKAGSLMAIPNEKFWHCMDTPKDVEELNSIWGANGGKWPQ